MALKKKDECETIIRHLCQEWRNTCGFADTPNERLSFSTFYSWVERHYSSYLRFRTTTSVRYDVEFWFEQEFGLTWRR